MIPGQQAARVTNPTQLRISLRCPTAPGEALQDFCGDSSGGKLLSAQGISACSIHLPEQGQCGAGSRQAPGPQERLSRYSGKTPANWLWLSTSAPWHRPAVPDPGLCLSLTFYLLEAPSAHRLALGCFHLTAAPGHAASRRQMLCLEQTQNKGFFFFFFFLLEPKTRFFVESRLEEQESPSVLPIFVFVLERGVSSALLWQLCAPTAQ